MGGDTEQKARKVAEEIAPHRLYMQAAIATALLQFAQEQESEASKWHQRYLDERALKEQESEAVRELVKGLEPFLRRDAENRQRYDKAQSAWYDKMPGDWPSHAIEVTMDELRKAAALVARYSRKGVV